MRSLPLSFSVVNQTEEQNGVLCVLTHIPRKDRRFFYPIDVIFKKKKNVVISDPSLC